MVAVAESTVLGACGPRSLKTGEMVAATLRQRIACGELLPGDHLPPEDELMAGFGLARTTVREGLRILESQGLLRIRRGRGGGGVVTVPDIDHLAQAFALRLQLQHANRHDLELAREILEPAIVARLAASHQEEDLAALAGAVDAATRAAEEGDRRGFLQAVTRVHHAISERAGSVTLTIISQLLEELVEHQYQTPGGPSTHQLDQFIQRASRSYRRLVRLVRQGDAHGAAEHWQRYLAASRTLTGTSALAEISALAET